MTERAVEDRLAALQRAGRTSAAASAPSPAAGARTDGPGTRRPRPAGSGGTKFALAGGAVGATLALIGVMSAGLPSADNPIAPQAQPVARPVIIVVNQPGPVAPADAGEAITAETVADLIPELPAIVETAPAARQPVTESGGS